MNVPVATAGHSQRFVRGWVVLTGIFGVMMITSGMVFYALGAFLDAFVDEQGFSTGLAGAGVGIFLLASGLCGYYTGKLVNRFDARWVITAGTAVSTVGMALLSQVRSGWQMFVVMSIFGIGFVLVMSSQVGAIQHMYKFTGDRLGLETAAAGAVQVLAGTSVVARICGGIAALKVSLRWLTMVLMVVQVIGLCMLAVAGSRLAILFGVLVLGSAMGNLLMLHPLILADAFGVRDYPRIYGFGSLLMVSGLAGGPFLTGLLNDAYSYRSAFFALAAIAAVGLVIYSFAGNPTRDYLTAPAPESEWAPPVRPRSARPTPTPVLTVTRDLPEGVRQPVLVGNGINGALEDAAELDEIEQVRRRAAPAVWVVESL